MINGVGKFEQSVYQNGKLLSSLEIGAKTDGNDLDFFIKNPVDKIEGSAPLSDKNIEKIMELFNQPSSSESLLERLENELNKSDDSKSNKDSKLNKNSKSNKDSKMKREKGGSYYKNVPNTNRNGGKKTKKKKKNKDNVEKITKKTKKK